MCVIYVDLGYIFFVANCRANLYNPRLYDSQATKPHNNSKPKEYGYTPEPKNKKDDGLAPTDGGNLS
jgi:hypothetical protein